MQEAETVDSMQEAETVDAFGIVKLWKEKLERDYFPPVSVGNHKNNFTKEDIQTILKATDENGILTNDALKTLSKTLNRRKESIQAKWGEILAKAKDQLDVSVALLALSRGEEEAIRALLALGKQGGGEDGEAI